MSSLKNLMERGVAEKRYTLVSLFRDINTGKVRGESWHNPGLPSPAEGEVEIGRITEDVILVRLHWGYLRVPDEEIPRLEFLLRVEKEEQRAAMLAAANN